MIISVPKETATNEKRVAITPDVVERFTEKNHEVRIEQGAGEASSYLDEHYEEVGAKVVTDADKIFSESDLVVKIQLPTDEQVDLLQEGTVLVCLLWALQNEELVEKLKNKKVTTLGMEAIPRISRAQSMDVLSSMASIAGYKAALLGANKLDRYMPMMMTAAGTIKPANVLVLGAGVAGLQAIATAGRLGAQVEAFDIRPEVKEQVESLGADFVEVPMEEEDTETEGGYAKELAEDEQERQRQVIHEHCAKSDIVITTARIPGKKPPLLVTEEMVRDMHTGAVIVDLAAEEGGNCEVTEPGETAHKHDVYVMGPLNLPSSMAYHASKLYAKNMQSLLDHLIDEEGELQFDFEDQITKDTTITHEGQLISPSVTGEEEEEETSDDTNTQDEDTEETKDESTSDQKQK